MSGLWKNWLRAAAVIVVLFGALIALFAFPATEAPMRLFFQLLGKPIPAEPGEHFRFAMGLMGCISVGWGLTLFFQAEALHHLPAGTATRFWRAMLGVTLLWYVIDNVASAYTGFWGNILSNTALLVMLAVPLFASGVLHRRDGAA